jgi:hypothetical protein
MKSIGISLLVLCTIFAGIPNVSWAGPQTIDSREKAELVALSLQQKIAAAPSATPPLAADERASLSLLGTENPSLLQQSAGERVLVIEDGGPRRHWDRRYGNGYIIGAVVLTLILVTVLVFGLRPAPDR